MDQFTYSTADDLAEGLLGWMEEGQRAEDTALLEWMRTAEVGEYTEHRLGVAVRLKDTNEKAQ